MFGLNPLNLKIIGALGVVILILLGAIALLGYQVKGLLERAAVAEEKLVAAQTINKQNARALRELQIDRQVERELTQKEIEAAQRRATSIDKLKKEMQNVPGANDPVHPYFDELGDRLRQSSDSGTAN